MYFWQQISHPTETRFNHRRCRKSNKINCALCAAGIAGNLWINFKFDVQGIHKRMVRFQKLTWNLFLTLHGHNVHRQQQQLSKFLMRYQQFAGVAFLNRTQNSGCAVIIDLDTSKRSTQKAFSSCEAILEIGPAAPQ